MSLYASMTTAISGLSAQSRALGHVADNVANSQTVGFKRTDTNFVSYVTRSTLRTNMPGSVQARPDYAHSIQGTIQQSENPLAMAIAGGGFFAVAAQRGAVNGQPAFDPNPLYTRAGDFRMDRNGYLVNGQGYTLQGWGTNTAGELDRARLVPMRVDQSVFNPVATTNVALAGNLPAASATGTASAQMQVYDALGRQHAVDMTWTRGANNVWSLSLDAPTATTPALGSIEVRFGDAAPPAPPPAPATPDGTIGAFGASTGLTGLNTGAGNPATISFDANFGSGVQTMTLNLGTFHGATGLTQYATDDFSVRSLEQNGIPLGSFSGVALSENGDLSVNYDNGQIRTIGRVPIVGFSDPDKLQRMDGQAFQRTIESGDARIGDASSIGTGKLVVNSLEGSNVDIASEFSKLILAQRAYTANTKIVTTTDEMLQETVNMRR